jgi:hypothetical protein
MARVTKEGLQHLDVSVPELHFGRGILWDRKGREHSSVVVILQK